MTSAESLALDQLKAELQSNTYPPSIFEELVATLLAKALDVAVALANSGFQHGGDAGVGGRQGRALRIECKRYTDSTALNQRELLGEVDHALDRDPGLEAWILAATRPATEQLEDALRLKANRSALPIVVIDWKSTGWPLLAALCTADPEVVERLYSKAAGDATRVLQTACAGTLASLKADLQAWALGFEEIRRRAAARLARVWSAPRSARAIMHQNVAGGAATLVQRHATLKSLSDWWDGASSNLALLSGPEGVGKTWTAVGWAVARCDDLPIVILLPASAAASLGEARATSILRLLGEQFYEASGGLRDVAHWEARVRRILLRPVADGPTIVLIIDGLNQQPDMPWEKLFTTLQDDPFVGRVRVLGTVRPTYLADRLGGLRRLIDRPLEINLGPFDDAELDERLALAGMQRDQLNSDLLQLARTPRLFDLVAKYHTSPDGGEMTLHRLLWEYGRDEEGGRREHSFSNDEWRAWLAGLAEHFRAGVIEVTRRDLAASIERADLNVAEIKARLDDIVDGHLTEVSAPGRTRFRPEAVAHALGLALLNLIFADFGLAETEITERLETWLEPISGLDQRAEILRAAVSILVARRADTDNKALSVLLTSWLTTQNLTEAHRHEIGLMVGPLRYALMDTVERTASYNLAGPRMFALAALNSLPRGDGQIRAEMFDRAAKWLSVISFDNLRLDQNPDPDTARERAKRLRELIGTSEAGEVVLLGRRMILAFDEDNEILQDAAVPLLDGHCLAGAVEVFETAALTLAVRGHSSAWKGLRWLCLLNNQDWAEAAVSLRQRSEAVRGIAPETGVDARLVDRIAALLLSLTGFESDEEHGDAIDPRLKSWVSYETDYLAQPATSWFALERRHAASALCDTRVALLRRIGRARKHLVDPTFEFPESFIVEVIQAAKQFPIAELHSNSSYTATDRDFELLEEALARCSPIALAELHHRKLRAPFSQKGRYWRAIKSLSSLLVADDDDGKAAYDLRLKPPCPDLAHSENWARTCLLHLEVSEKPSLEQARIILGADLEYVELRLLNAVGPLTVAEAELLLAEHRADASMDRAGILTTLFFKAPIDKSEVIWTWLEEAALQKEQPHRGLLFRLLATKDRRRFGRLLDERSWSWSATEPKEYVSHYGSLALIEATSVTPFDQLLPRLAPWHLLRAARVRGAVPAELELAAEVLGRSILSVTAAPEIATAVITVDNTRDAPGSYAIEPQTDIGTELKLTSEARRAVHHRTIDDVVARVADARAKGAYLFLRLANVQDLKALAAHSPRQIDAWLEGLETETRALRQRIGLAQGLYLVLCEALLEMDPERGIRLWHAMMHSSGANYVGLGKADEALLMVFRVPDSPPVAKLRRELLSLEQASNDQDLADLVFAALAAGRRDWVESVISEDAAAAQPWRQLRAIRLAALTVENPLEDPEAWPSGEVRTSTRSLRHISAHRRVRDAAARHWWAQFLQAPTKAAAYAAWVLFKGTADRRAYLWMRREREMLKSDLPLERLKDIYVVSNRQDLENAIEKRDEDLSKHFLNRQTYDGARPWRSTIPIEGR